MIFIRHRRKLGIRTNLDTESNVLLRSHVYQVQCDGEVSACYTGLVGGKITLSSGNSNPPTTYIGADGAYQTEGQRCCSGWVAKGDFWKVTDSDVDPTITWLPFGKGGCVDQS